jgi:hypothetical protein
MPHYRYRERVPGSAWEFTEAVDANTAKAKIPVGVILEVQSSVDDAQWIAVPNISTDRSLDRPTGGNRIAVRGPDGRVYESILKAAETLGLKYGEVQRWANGRKHGWSRV